MRNLSTLALGLAVAAGAAAQDKSLVPAMDPSSTTVALLPVLNVSGEKWEELKLRQVERGSSELAARFLERGFRLVNPDEVAEAIAQIKLDLTDEEQWRRDNLYQVAKLVAADLVCFAVITDTSQRLVQQFLVNKREGSAKLKIWLLDAKNEKPIFSGQVFEGKSGGGAFAGLDKGSDRQVIAVANAIRDALKPPLQAYPVLAKVERGK